jgi:prepilin-type N-terminal cleavage/methylation domain-containing protein
MERITHTQEHVTHNKRGSLCDVCYVLRDKNGFTLVELLIYIAIIGMVMTTFVYFGMTIFDYRNKSNAAQEVQANERMALSLMSQKIRGAKDVNIASSTFNSDPGVLSLVMDDISKNPTIFSLTKADGSLQIAEGGTSTTTVTSKNVLITNLVFTNLTATSGIAEDIGINMTMQYNNTSQDVKNNYSDSLETAVSIRR